eukprot:366212-Chlamydomonas_euryale.AAC.14
MIPAVARTTQHSAQLPGQDELLPPLDNFFMHDSFMHGGRHAHADGGLVQPVLGIVTALL